MRPHYVLIAISSVVLSFSGAGAQVMDAQWAAFLHSPLYHSLIRQGFARLPEAVYKQCPTLVSASSRITIVTPVSVGADGIPKAGLWRHAFPVSGCGNDTVLNFFFAAGARGKINTLIGLPGTTRADLALQRDAVAYANVGARLVVKGCDTLVITNTKFEAFGLENPPTSDPGSEARFRPWWETWTMTACGHESPCRWTSFPTRPGHRSPSQGMSACSDQRRLRTAA